MHLNIKQEGRVAACWRHLGKLGDYRDSTLEEIWNSEEIRELRRALLHGEQPYDCRACWDCENSGIESPRTTSNFNGARSGVTEENMLELMGDDYSMPISALKKLEIRFDNVCNLMCRHCSPQFSSRWEAAVNRDKEFYNQMKPHTHLRVEDNHVRLTDKMIDEAIEMSSHLTHIMVAGGEPLMHPRHYEFLEKIQSEADHIHLDYNSNLHILGIKGHNVIDLWKKFKSFQIRVSIDGYPPIYSYFRVGSEIESVVANLHTLIEEMPRARIQTTCTTGVLNITRLTEIFDFYNSIGGFIHASLIQTPRALNPKILPPELKRITTEKWLEWSDNIEENITKTAHPRILESEYSLKKQLQDTKNYGDTVINYMNSEDWYHDWHKFEDYASSLDAYHKTNLLDVYPEFEPYWKKS